MPALPDLDRPATALLLATLASTAPADAQTVVNGDFTQFVPANATGGGWSSGGIFAGLGAGGHQFSLGLPAPAFALDAANGSLNTAFLFQLIDGFVVGQEYEVSGDYGSFRATDAPNLGVGGQLGSQMVAISMGGQPIATGLAGIPIGTFGALGWRSFNATFVATATSLELRFTAPVANTQMENDCIVDNVTIVPVGGGPVGSAFCAPAVPNSTGLPGLLRAVGSPAVALNDLQLIAEQLPPGVFGFFLASRGTAITPNIGGGQGTFCLDGTFGRGVGGQIYATDASGAMSAVADLSALPLATGPTAALVGETWHFQAWHRDALGGVATSNLTHALTVVFESRAAPVCRGGAPRWTGAGQVEAEGCMIRKHLHLNRPFNGPAPAGSRALESDGHLLARGLFGAEEIGRLRSEIESVYREFPPD